MLTILAPPDHFDRHRALYAGTTLAGVNFAHNFVVSGAQPTLAALKRRLDELAVVSVLLPVMHAFHSPAMDAIEQDFKQSFGGVAMHAPRWPVYSATHGGALDRLDAEHFWRVARGRTDFPAAVDAVLAQGPCRFVDLGPSGTLATFIKHGYVGRVAQAPAINQFGRNLQSLSRLFTELAV
jgi:acyl transferase domain-containing protein